MAKKRSVLEWVVLVLVLVGALNWGLVGVANLDLVALILGAIPILQKVVYILVGLAALYMIYQVATEK